MVLKNKKYDNPYYDRPSYKYVPKSRKYDRKKIKEELRELIEEELTNNDKSDFEKDL